MPASKASSRPFLQLSALGAGLAIGTLAGAALVWQAWTGLRADLTQGIRRIAERQGLELTLGQVELGLGFVQLYDSKFQLLGVPGAKGTLRRIDIDADWLTPKKVTLFDITLTLTGEPRPLVQGLTEWSQRYGKRTALPAVTVETRGLDVAYQSAQVGPPLVELRGLALTPEGTGTNVTVAQLRAYEFSIAQFRAHLVQRPTGLSLALATAGLPTSTWELTQSLAGTELRATVPVQRLLPLLPLRYAMVVAWLGSSPELGGQLRAFVPSSAGNIAGELNVEVHGFQPPLPAELRGFPLSDQSTLKLTFEAPQSLDWATLHRLEVNDAPLKFLGNGRITRHDRDFVVEAQLKTALECRELAMAMAKPQLGVELGPWATRAASSAVTGQVGVTVQVSFDSRNPADAKLARQLGIGCGLRPLTLDQMLGLGLPPLVDPRTIPAVRRMLDPKQPLPSFSLPPLPRIDLRLPGDAAP